MTALPNDEILHTVARTGQHAGSARWFRFADGLLALRANDAAFLGRFAEIHRPLRIPAPPDPPGLQLHADVTVHADPPATLLRLAGAPVPPGLVGRLLESQGYRVRDDRGDWRRWAPPSPAWPEVADRDSALVLDRRGPWQWLAAHVAVSTILALQPQFLFFHAAAVAIRDRGVLLMGARGHGKTSVALALAAAGHGFLGDEIGAVRWARRELVAVPRAALVRPVSQGEPELDGPWARRAVHPPSGPHTAPLWAVIALRRFAARTRLERFEAGSAQLELVTPMVSTLAGGDEGPRALRILELVASVDRYVLDAASPESAAGAVAEAVAG